MQSRGFFEVSTLLLSCFLGLYDRPVVQLVEHRSPKPGVGGSSPSWPANNMLEAGLYSLNKTSRGAMQYECDYGRKAV
jgi:hypothetical protein